MDSEDDEAAQMHTTFFAFAIALGGSAVRKHLALDVPPDRLAGALAQFRDEAIREVSNAVPHGISIEKEALFIGRAREEVGKLFDNLIRQTEGACPFDAG